MTIKLNEKTMENMSVLSDCVELIIKNLPSKFPKNVTDGIDCRNMSGLYQLIEKYKGTIYEQAFKDLSRHEIFIINKWHGGTAGSYIAKPRMEFRFYLPALIGDDETITREQLLAFRGTKSIKTFRGIVIHELRHWLQSYLYSKYYYGRSDNQSYQTNPVEVDAAWMHHLQDYDPKDFETAKSYTAAVMKSFGDYKKLDARMTDHYYRKTMRYYQDAVNGEKPDLMQLSLKDRVKVNQAVVRDMIMKSIPVFKNDYDLRTIEGYDRNSKMFLFPLRVMNTLIAAIAHDKVIGKQNAPLLFLTLSLFVQPKDAAVVRRHLLFVQKVTLDDALSNLETAFSDGWDTMAIRNKISGVFGD